MDKLVFIEQKGGIINVKSRNRISLHTARKLAKTVVKAGEVSMMETDSYFYFFTVTAQAYLVDMIMSNIQATLAESKDIPLFDGTTVLEQQH